MPKDTQEALAECPDIGGHHEDWHNADVVCGGFPCQDISNAGRRAGITAERSGLWGWLCGAIRLVRPKYALVENVAALLANGMDTVLGDLAEIGYDAEWDCIPTGVSNGHIRDRIFLVANPMQQGLQGRVRAGKNGIDETKIQKHWSAGLAKHITPSDPKQKWGDRPLLGRGIHGIPFRVDRIKSLGNAVVPQIPEIIGKAVMNAHNAELRREP